MGKKNGLVRRAGEEKRMDSNNIHLRLEYSETWTLLPLLSWWMVCGVGGDRMNE